MNLHRKGRPARMLLACAAVWMLGTGPAGAAAVSSLQASGSGVHWWRQCSTCPDELVRDSQSDGGPGRAAAQVSGGADGFGFASSAAWVGITSLPELKARAETWAPHSPAIYTTASATAQAVQAYVYLGSAETDYTITFSIDGLLRGDSESVEAGLSVFGSDWVPGGEGQGHGTPLAGDALRIALSNPPGVVSEIGFDEARGVSFHVAPGDTFFVSAYLLAGSFFGGLGAPSAPGLADAFHTFQSAFTAGDTTLLRVQAATVAEPPAWVLAVAGMLALAGHRRRRR